MLVRNNLESSNTTYLKQSQTARDKNDLLSGQQLQETQTAAELTISKKLQQKIEEKESANDVAAENALSAQSDAWDVAKAEEMIRQANRNILNHASDAVIAQSGQTAEVAIELLK